MTEGQSIVEGRSQQGLRCFDKGQLIREELEIIMGICFETGQPTKDWDRRCLREVLMQLSDRNLITGDVIRKCLFNLPPKEKLS